MTLPKAWIEKAPLVMATKMCVGPERLKVRFILREEPNNPTDSGWVFFSGFEPEGYNEDSANFVICPLVRFLELEPSIKPLIESPVGSVFEKATDKAPWSKVEDYAL